MVTWIHSLCGKPTNFRDGYDPNTARAICRNCQVALGGWTQA